MLFSRHDPDVLYHGSQYVAASRDQGGSWDGDLARPDGERHHPLRPSRRPHHRRRDGRGDILGAAPDRRVASQSQRAMDRLQRRPRARHPRRRRHLDRRDAPRDAPAGDRQPDRGVAPPGGDGVPGGLPLSAGRLPAVRLCDPRLRCQLDAPDRRRQRDPRRPSHPRGAGGPAAGRDSSTRAPSSASSLPSTRAALGNPFS